MSRGRFLLPVLLLAPACFDLSRPEPAGDAQPDVARLDTARPESGVWRPDHSVDFKPDASVADTSAPDTTRADTALPADSSLPPKDTALAVDACAPQPEIKGSVFASPGLLLCRVSASGDTVSFYERSQDKSCSDLAGSLTLTGATISGSAGPQFIAIALCSVSASGNVLSFSLLGAQCSVNAGTLTLAGATASGGAAGDVLCGCSGSGQVLTFYIRDDVGKCNKKAGTITLAGTTTCP